MTRRFLILGGAALIATAGCNSFLTEQTAVLDPNNPSSFTRDQLLAGIEANMLDQQEGGVAMLICQWMQQCASNAGRFVELQGHYVINNTSFSLNFNSVYTGGGLVSIRAAQASAEADGNLQYKGVLEVLEAMQVGWGADIWGDIPYSDAAGDNPTPTFDAQMAIYDALQLLLDKAITDLNGAGSGPGVADFLYNGDKTKWIKLAHMMKARLYLHTVEKLGNGQYTKALAEANLGFTSPSDGLFGIHGSAGSERNMWAQFQTTSFGNDLVAGKPLVDLMKAQGDPRLPEYFGKAPDGQYHGWDAVLNVGDNGTRNDPVSPILGSARTDNPVFPQPLVTFEEKQLIQAEANFVLNGAAAAQPFLDAVRLAHGKPSVPATLRSIAEEKYILMYQNVEAWNDFKRLCFPRLKPASATPAVPGRILYGSTEAQTNPDQPEILNEPAFPTGRNANDPAACPTS
jgi:starch-binding outer membrane protein, SusD/RagB family